MVNECLDYFVEEDELEGLEKKSDDDGSSQGSNYSKTSWLNKLKEQRKIHQHFKKLFKACIKLYLEGRWLDAHDKFKDVLKINPKDGPSLRLLEFIEKYNCDSMLYHWKGFRELEDK